MRKAQWSPEPQVERLAAVARECGEDTFMPPHQPRSHLGPCEVEDKHAKSDSRFSERKGCGGSADIVLPARLSHVYTCCCAWSQRNDRATLSRAESSRSASLSHDIAMRCYAGNMLTRP